MALMSGIGMPASAIRRQIGSALDLVVHLERRPDGSRQVTELIEILDWREQTAAIRRIYRKEQDP